MDGTATGDHGSGGKAAKVKGQKKKVERSKTFRDKDKEKDKDKDKVEKGGGAGDGGGGWRIPEQQVGELLVPGLDVDKFCDREIFSCKGIHLFRFLCCLNLCL